VLPIIEQIIKTVCGWVTSTITVIQQVVSQICGYLPWPFNKLCKAVVDLISVIKTITDWVCNTVVNYVTTFITQVISVLQFVTQWVCVITGIVIGFPGWLLCILGLSPKKKLRVCVKVITDELGYSQVTNAAIEENMMFMRSAFGKQCGIEVLYEGIERIVKPAYLSTTDCSFWGLFSVWHTWFSQRACLCCQRITVFFVDDIIGLSDGCTYWGEHFCRVDSGCNFDQSVMAHEVGHILNLSHSSDPNNIMYGAYSATAENFTSNQCCAMKNSAYTIY